VNLVIALTAENGSEDLLSSGSWIVRKKGRRWDKSAPAEEKAEAYRYCSEDVNHGHRDPSSL
jgi:hypothetical protein